MDVQSSTSRQAEAGAPRRADAQGSEAVSRTRTLLAIGDLHGDYYRLLRHLRENDLLLPDTLAWNPEKNRHDLILIGDYVDWRGETLEGPLDQTPDEPATGARRILELLMLIENELEALRRAEPDFDSHSYPLLGNHDEMMIDALAVFEFMKLDQLQDLLGRARNFAVVKRQITDAGMAADQVEKVLRFLNWYVQGGESTMRGFGGLQGWKDAMDGDLGRFLKKRLRLAVVVNDRMFSHTVPDHRKFWKPVEDIVNLPDADFRAARESFLWSRKVWGYDYYTGMRTSPFSEKELDEMLEGLGVRGIVVGHTPLARGPDPVVAYGGRVINLDVHGTPGANALVEEYMPTARGSRAPLRNEA